MLRHKFLILCCMGYSFITAGLIVWSGTPQSVRAQCGDVPPDSSCITCHEKEYPVFDQGEWHGLHARKDCCAQCHGGNCSAADKNLAHVGMVANPLEDIYTNCYHCHPDDYPERAGRFALALGVTPGSRPTPTRAPMAFAAAHSSAMISSLVMPEQALATGASPIGLGAFLGVISLAILALGIEIRYIFSHSRE